MAEQLRRPGPYVPLSTTFGTGRTGTAIYDRFGLAGLGAWAMLIAAAAPTGTVLFRHEQDWPAIGVAQPPDFSLLEFLTFLGRRKQTRKTRHGHVVYVELTRWSEWNKTKEREDARLRMSRYRQQSRRNDERNGRVTPGVTKTEQDRHPEAEADTEEEQVHKPSAVDVVPTRVSAESGAEPEWGAVDEEQPEDFSIPGNILKEMTI